MHNNNFSRRGQEHFVSSVDETGLGAVDAVADESAPRLVPQQAISVVSWTPCCRA